MYGNLPHRAERNRASAAGSNHHRIYYCMCWRHRSILFNRRLNEQLYLDYFFGRDHHLRIRNQRHHGNLEYGRGTNGLG